MTARIAVESDRLRLGETFSVVFQRTLRIPDDDRTYPLPPGLGRLPLRQIDTGRSSDQPPLVLVPLRRREAVWLGFDAPTWRPHAILIGLGTVDAVSGGAWTGALSNAPQNYLVCPPQLWLDGVKVARDRVRQFVATPLGTGTTVEAQLAGGADEGRVRLIAFEPQPGYFPDAPPPASSSAPRVRATAGGIGLGAGGQIRQRVYPDPHGLEAWNPGDRAEVEVRLVTADAFHALTGEAAPPTPVDAATYTAHGFPWFEMYDEPDADLRPTAEMEGVRSIDEIERTRTGDTSIDVPDSQVTRLRPRSHH